MSHSEVEYIPLTDIGQPNKVKGSPDSEVFESIVVEIDGREYREAEAIEKLLQHGNKLARIPARIISLFPASISNAVYRFVARNRFHWFGKADEVKM